MINVAFDFNKIEGKIKELHGVNNSPTALKNTVPTFTDAGIPYMRTHDSMGAFGGSHYVDIPNVFPNFDADETDPTSYDFAFTDAYLSNIIKSGTKIFYRLGVTIENNWQIKAFNIDPPKDYNKWARICEHIIRHYNEGWADGFHFGIEYWEIWNEPENPSMWTGTREQYYALYSVAANHLKQCFPNIKIGGYAGCGFYYVTGHGTDDFNKGLVTFFDEFLDYISAEETHAPLDFFSWHIYTSDPYVVAAHADYVWKTLDEKGYWDVEHILDEWNRTYPSDSVFDDMKNEKGASFCVQVLNIMQESSLSKAMYYDAYPARRYCGMYYFPSYKPTKTYFSFYAFNRLYRLGNCVGTRIFKDSGVSACAATNGEDRAVLLSNYSKTEEKINLTLDGEYDTYLTDKEHTFKKNAIGYTGGEITLPAYSVVLLETRK